MTTRSNLPLARILTEGAVIIVSILLAFAIDAGWDLRQEWAARDVALDDLRSELAESLPLIDSTRAQIEGDLRFMRGMLSDPDRLIAEVAHEAYGDIVEAVFRPSTSDDNSTAIESALSDPRVQDVQDDGIRSATAAWRQYRTEVEERGGAIVQAEAVTMELLARDPAIQALFAGYGGSRVASEWASPIDPATLRRMAETPEIRAAMARKAIQTQAQLQWIGELAMAAERLIAEIDRVR
jgi:hypothetical protein